MGSGTLLIPAMVLIFAIPQKSVQGVALAVMVPMALVGATRYVLNRDIPVDLRVAALIAAGAVGGVLVGTEIASRLPAHVLRRIFGVFLIVVAARMLVASRRSNPASQPAAAARASSAEMEPLGRMER